MSNISVVQDVGCIARKKERRKRKVNCYILDCGGRRGGEGRKRERRRREEKKRGGEERGGEERMVRRCDLIE
jgi:hypothetical protein